MPIIYTCFLLALFYGKNPSSFTQKLVILSISTSILGGILYLIEKRNVIELDDENLYVFDRQSKEKFEILLERVDKILYSIIGFKTGSYRIIYRDNNSKIKTLRIFLRVTRSDIDTIIQKTKKKNPNIEVCHWTFGLNEFFD